MVNDSKVSTGDLLKKCNETASASDKIDCMVQVLAKFSDRVESFIDMDAPMLVASVKKDLGGTINQLDREMRKSMGMLDDNVKEKLSYVYQGLIAIDEELKPIALTHASMSNTLNRFIVDTAQNFTRLADRILNIESRMATKDDLKAINAKLDALEGRLDAFATKDDLDAINEKLDRLLANH